MTLFVKLVEAAEEDRLLHELAFAQTGERRCRMGSDTQYVDDHSYVYPRLPRQQPTFPCRLLACSIRVTSTVVSPQARAYLELQHRRQPHHRQQRKPCCGRYVLRIG